MSQQSNEIISVYGYDKKQRSQEILNHAAPSQLPILYGGTKQTR